jgi:alpha-tubulin suppressor-like RCC1 family protein
MLPVFFLAPWLAVSVAAGDDYTCAITRGGAVKCWGTNSIAQLGDGSTERRHLPVEVAGARGAGQIDADNHTCANLHGTLYCWGGDFWVGRHTQPRPLPAYGTVSQFSVGSDYTCVVDPGHKLRCGGRGEDGILVAGMEQSYEAEHPGPVPGLDVPVKQVAAGTFHACALGTDGRVRCWGSNSWSHLFPGVEKVIPLPRVVEKLEGVTDLQAGATHTCALRRRSGEVWCWGYNLNGQLGDGTTESDPEPKKLALPRILRLAAGAFTTCAVDQSKAVWCWGNNQFGAAGAPGGDVLSPRQVAGISEARTVSCGGNHCCAVTGNGRIQCWGSNQFGQLGVGRPIAESATPVDVVQSY